MSKKRSKRPEIRKEYMTILRPCFHFHGIQFKSPESIRYFAYYLDKMESLVGIMECTISFEDIFVCPDIGIGSTFTPETPMEELLVDLIKQLQ